MTQAQRVGQTAYLLRVVRRHLQQLEREAEAGEDRTALSVALASVTGALDALGPLDARRREAHGHGHA
jgi:hypothetical protein